MQVSLRDPLIVLILICGSVSIITSLLILVIDFEDKQTEEHWDALFGSISLSSVGVALFTLRKFGTYKEIFDSLELLILLVLPTIAIMPIVSEPKINLIIFAPVYLGAVIGWFLLVKTYFAKPLPKGNEQDKTHRSMNILWGVLMIFGAAFIGVFIFKVLPTFVNSLK